MLSLRTIREKKSARTFAHKIKNMSMKQMFFVCCALLCMATGLKAQVFEISEITPINEKISEVKAGAQSLRVNHIVRDSIVANPGKYLLAVAVYKSKRLITVVSRNNISWRVTEVLSVEPDDNKWLVKLSNGVNYLTSNPEWKTVIPGQHVCYSHIKGETEEWTYLPHTVGRDVPLTKEVQISPAPTKPIIVLDEENKPVGGNL